MPHPGLTFEVVRPSAPPAIRADRGAMAALCERGPNGAVTVRSRAELDRMFGCPRPGMLGARAGRAFFDNGGAELIVARIVPEGAAFARGALPLASGASLPLRAAEAGAFADAIEVDARVAIERRLDATVTSDIEIACATAIAADVGRAALVSDGTIEAWATIAGAVAGASYTVTALPPALVGASVLVSVHARTFALRVSEPDRAAVAIEGLSLADLDDVRRKLEGSPIALDGAAPGAPLDLPLPGSSVRLRGGDDGLDSTAPLAPAFRAAFDAIDASSTADIVFCPDLWSRIYATKGVARAALSAADARALSVELVQRAARLADRVVLLDAPLGGAGDLEPLSVPEIEAWRSDLERELGADRDFAAVYAPWARIAAPELAHRGDETLLVPPSPYVAGRIARTSLSRGAWIATGAIELERAIGLSDSLDAADLDALSDLGVNPLLATSRGVEIQGVRSLSAPDRRAWRFLATRRLFNYLRRALAPIGMSYAFEPNGPATWAQLRRDLESLLRDLFARGAFAGANAREAFFVVVDAALNPEEAREDGVLTARIGVAPAAPLEFLHVRLVARREGTTLVEERS